MSHDSKRDSSWIDESSSTVEHAIGSNPADAGLAPGAAADSSTGVAAEGEEEYRFVHLGPVPEWDGPGEDEPPKVPGDDAPPALWKKFALDQMQPIYDQVLEARPHLDGPELARLNASFGVFVDTLRQAESLRERRLSESPPAVRGDDAYATNSLSHE
jgi:hypothetical protein